MCVEGTQVLHIDKWAILLLQNCVIYVKLVFSFCIYPLILTNDLLIGNGVMELIYTS